MKEKEKGERERRNNELDKRFMREKGEKKRERENIKREEKI